MPRYHINAKGTPGLCRAKKSCPFGDMEADHYSTPDQAREAYEAYATAYFEAKAHTKDGRFGEQLELFSEAEITGEEPDGQLSFFSEEEVREAASPKLRSLDDFRSFVADQDKAVIKVSADDHEIIMAQLTKEEREVAFQAHREVRSALDSNMDMIGELTDYTPEELFSQVELDPQALQREFTIARQQETAYGKAILATREAGSKGEVKWDYHRDIKVDFDPDHSNGLHGLTVEDSRSHLTFPDRRAQTTFEKKYAAEVGDDLGMTWG